MGRRHGAWIASLAMHLVLGAMLLTLPDREPEPEPFASLTPIELVEPIEPGAAAVGHGAPDVGEAAGADDSTAPMSPTEPVRMRGRNGKRPPAIEPVLPNAPSSGDGDASVTPPVALHGLRGDRAAVPRPSAGILDLRGAGDRYGPDAAPSADSFETPHEAGFRRNRKGELVYRDPDPAAQWSATLLPDGRVQFEDRLTPRIGEHGIVMPGLKELIPASRGFDFWQARKRRLLKATRELRLRMAVEHAEGNIKRQLGQLYRDLLEIWQDADQSAASRRELIFRRWDECVESLSIELGDFTDDEPSKIDSLRENAGTKARARILEFVRRHVPEDGPDPFTLAELRDMNARRASRERFEPYGEAPP